MSGRSWTQRVVAAASLDVNLYEEVEADTTATGQAAAVVALASIAHGIGASSHGNLVGALVGSLVGWVIWAGLTYFIGSRIFHGTATWGELARTLGFAQSPGLLYVLGVLPLLGGVIVWVIGVWILIAGIIAIRQALDISTGKAVAVALVGWLVLVLCTLLLGGLMFGAFR